mmetsp:Transcript_20098/g.59913  ORF Transcript_20098/g.59913 Transcript_20098/m.59913 type:complete len:206 (-) Transcript_20098:33-650(-)
MAEVIDVTSDAEDAPAEVVDVTQSDGEDAPASTVEAKPWETPEWKAHCEAKRKGSEFLSAFLPQGLDSMHGSDEEIWYEEHDMPVEKERLFVTRFVRGRGNDPAEPFWQAHIARCCAKKQAELEATPAYRKKVLGRVLADVSASPKAWSVADLKRVCKDHALPRTGTKARLLERLREAVDGAEPKRQRLWADEDSSDGEAEFAFD